MPRFATAHDRLRQLPSVHDVLVRLGGAVSRFPHALVVAEIRLAIDRARSIVLSNGVEHPIEDTVTAALSSLTQHSLRRVINATGVVLHTNLGRAPLGPLTPLTGYSNLEYDLASGKRGKRDAHLSPLLERLLGRPAIAVNNGAAALYLALHELAAGHEVIVSRGELIEIGDGFRIPDIMRSSGAILVEVGTTNRTRIGDYRDAITDRTRLLLRVHPSNFHISGFTGRPYLAELATLGRERNIPVYEDLGSGCFVDLHPFGITEPLIQQSLDAGVDLVSCSGDKLLGGPQAGILAGNPELIARIRRNPMFRALRLDKLITQTLENTLRQLLLENWESIPAIRMIRMTPDEIRARAERLLTAGAELQPGESVIGGGSTPDQSIPTWLIAIAHPNVVAAEKRLRSRPVPVIARIEDDKLLLDLRTVFPEDEDELRAALSELAPTN